MTHKRSRPGWGNKGFKYWAKPIDPIEKNFPAIIYEHSELMREMWNRCVEFNLVMIEERNSFCREKESSINDFEKIYNDLCHEVDDLYKEFKQAKIKYSKYGKNILKILDDRIKLLQKDKRSAWIKLKTVRNETAKKFKYNPIAKEKAFLQNISKTYQGYGLSGDNVEGIAKSFSEAVERSKKGIGKLPKIKDQSIFSFRVRYKDTGRKFEKLNKRYQKNTTFWINPPDERGRTKFYWKIGDQIITFKSIIHRPLPDEGFIKSVILSKDMVSKRWSIIFSVELPPTKLSHGNKVFYFKPRWTIDHFCDDLLAGELYVKIGDEEVFHPVRLFNELGSFNNEPSWHTILQIKGRKKERKKGDPPFQGEPIGIEDNRSKANQALDSLKSEIKSLLDKLKGFGWNGDLTFCGIKGIKEIQEIFHKNIPCHPINDIIFDGIRTYYYHMNHSNGIDRRIRKYREWCYWNFAKKIAEQASLVKLEKINFKELGKIKEIAKINQRFDSRIRKYKSYAAHYSLYDKIRKKCAEHGVKVIDVDPGGDGSI